jgi:hypothetical protein
LRLELLSFVSPARLSVDHRAVPGPALLRALTGNRQVINTVHGEVITSYSGIKTKRRICWVLRWLSLIGTSTGISIEDKLGSPVVVVFGPLGSLEIAYPL